MPHSLCPNMLPVHDLELNGVGMVTDWDVEGFLPDRVEVILEECSLDKHSLVEEDSDEGVSPVTSADVKEGAVSVREISGSNNINPDQKVVIIIYRHLS